MRPAEIYACPSPAPYPQNPDALMLIAALNDTYLAWEECHDNLLRLQRLDHM